MAREIEAAALDSVPAVLAARAAACPAGRRALPQLRDAARRALVPRLRPVVRRLPPLAGQAGRRGARRACSSSTAGSGARCRTSCCDPARLTRALPRRPSRGAGPAVPAVPDRRGAGVPGRRRSGRRASRVVELGPIGARAAKTNARGSQARPPIAETTALADQWLTTRAEGGREGPRALRSGADRVGAAAGGAGVAAQRGAARADVLLAARRLHVRPPDLQHALAVVPGAAARADDAGVAGRAAGSAAAARRAGPPVRAPEGDLRPRRRSARWSACWCCSSAR